jgi:hypothetical protein
MIIRAIVLAAFLAPTLALAQHDHAHMAPPAATAMPKEPGQSAFAAIQEIVGVLEADPQTDWSKVNIDALRAHLVDMNNVTLGAEVNAQPIVGGMRYSVTGVGPVGDSVRRMALAHAATMNGVDGWRFEASPIEGGAVLSVWAPEADLRKLRGLGFFGVMARGMHHQAHHLAIARGDHPH